MKILLRIWETESISKERDKDGSDNIYCGIDNYTPPTGQKIDNNAQALDRVQNNLTNEQVMRNTVNGKYNVKR